MGVGRIFFREGGDCGFFQGIDKSFSKGASSGKISFYQFKTKKNIFSAEKLIKNYQISKSMAAKPSLPPPFRNQ